MAAVKNHWAHDPERRAVALKKLKRSLAEPETRRRMEWWRDAEKRKRATAKRMANPKWLAYIETRRKTGNTKLHQGRVYVYCGRGDWRPRARVVMEEHLDRRLNTHEHVHHLNEDKTDDRLENLAVTVVGAHNRIHRQARGKVYDPERRALIVRLKNDGLSLAAIGREVGITPQSVRGHLRRHATNR